MKPVFICIKFYHSLHIYIIMHIYMMPDKIIEVYKHGDICTNHLIYVIEKMQINHIYNNLSCLQIFHSESTISVHACS